MMKLYSWDLSPYSARVRMQVYYKNLSHIIIAKPSTYGSPEFYQANPIGRLPILEIEGESIAESNVIAEYLEEVYPQPSMLGSTPSENARVRTLARVGDVYLLNSIFQLATETRVLGAEHPVTTGNEAAVQRLSSQLASSLEALEQLLGDDGFACLGRITLADCALVPALFLMSVVLPGSGLLNPIEQNPTVASYWSLIQREECARRILDELRFGVEERRDLIRSHASEDAWANAYKGHQA